jgi:hypothetical protein
MRLTPFISMSISIVQTEFLILKSLEYLHQRQRLSCALNIIKLCINGLAQLSYEINSTQYLSIFRKEIPLGNNRITQAAKTLYKIISFQDIRE